MFEAGANQRVGTGVGGQIPVVSWLQELLVHLRELKPQILVSELHFQMLVMLKYSIKPLEEKRLPTLAETLPVDK
jgi:hypothetical protein